MIEEFTQDGISYFAQKRYAACCGGCAFESYGIGPTDECIAAPPCSSYNEKDDTYQNIIWTRK